MKKLFFMVMVMTLALPVFSFATAPVEDTACGSNHTVPVVSATYDVEVGVRGILLTWNMINDSDFAGYKIVISKNDSTPNYPSNGYLYYTTDKTTTGFLINNARAYNNGDFGSYLTVGQDYYFSITAMYTCSGTTSYVPGNVLHLTYRGGLRDTTDPVQNTCDLNGDSARNLSDISLFSQCSSTFDANNDGAHNLIDVSEYAGNYQNQSWCDLYMTECMYETIDPTRHLAIVDTRITNISDTVTRVYWATNIGSNGQYRYSKNQGELSSLSWREDGVSNNPEVTENFGGSQVDLSGLEAGTTYYIEVRKYLGAQYGLAKILTFVPGSMGDYFEALDISKTRVDNITMSSARVYWQAVNMSGSGHYRYATTEAGLDNLPWLTTGVSNDPAVTGNMNASMVTLNNLQPLTKYYVEVKKTSGIIGDSSYKYGDEKIAEFVTLGDGVVLPDPIAKIKVCHLVGNGRTNTLEVAADAVAAHTAHGDKLGECNKAEDDSVRPNLPVSAKLIERVRGRILLQVESHGEAWYVNPKNDGAYYLKDGSTAYTLMREAGLGITNTDLAKIPVGFEDRFSDADSDGDGLADKLESGLGTDPSKPDTDGDGVKDKAEILAGTNPLGVGALARDNSLVNRLLGRIVLQVESRGEAWYIDPSDGRRYYMRDGEAAYQIMRFRSLGISNSDLSKITR